MDKYWNHQSKYTKALIYHREAGWRGGEAVYFANQFLRLNNSIEQKTLSKEALLRLKKMKDKISQAFWQMHISQNLKRRKINIKNFQKDFNNIYCEHFTIRQEKLPRKMKKKFKKLNHFHFEVVLKPEFCIDSMMLEIEKDGE